MKYDEKDMLDLNEENVRKVFNYTLATSNTPKDIIGSYSFISTSCNINIPKMNFDKTKLKEMKASINYMLGQFKAVHSNSLSMGLQDGFQKYDGSTWTNNKFAVFSLYYLGVATTQLPRFEPRPSNPNNLFSPIVNQSSLEPTLSPNDSNFRKKVVKNQLMTN